MFNAYENPVRHTVFSAALADSVNVQLLVPQILRMSPGMEFPLLFLLDSQNDVNYAYHTHTVDYLTALGGMPAVLLVGVELPHDRRVAWTVPNDSGGRADDFIRFLADELPQNLRPNYSLADFHLLVGHSRTAIFSMYALSRRHDFFDGAIAASPAYFDFGDSLQKAAFDHFLEVLPSLPQDYHLHISTGEDAFGDRHEQSVEQLAAYLRGREVPSNLRWAYHKEKADHYLTPGLLLNRALADIFTDYRGILWRCFAVLKDSTAAHRVPWDRLMAPYDSVSHRLGYPVKPGLLFYNSLASAYLNDYEGRFKENAPHLVVEVLTKAITEYPNDYGLHAWLGEACLETGDAAKAKIHLKEALALLAGQTDKESQELSAEIRRVLETIK